MPLEKRAAAAVGVTVGRWRRRRRRTGQGAAALHPAGLTLTSFFFSFFFYITKLEAWQGERTGFFDLDEGRNVEYEPEMTSQAGFRFKLTRRKKKINYVCVCVCTDPSDYSRTAGLPILTHPLPCSVHLCTPHPNNFPQTCASNLSHTKKSGAYLRTWFVSGNHLRVSVKRLYGIKKKRRKKKCLVTTGPRSL